VTDTPATRRKRLARQVWYRDGLAFECQGCGACCSGDPGFVWVNDTCRAEMCKRLGISEEEFDERYTRHAHKGRCLTERENGDCVLLDEETRRCLVYEERPVQCRTWPWWPENLESKHHWDRCAEDCPGINRGRTHSASYILEELEKDRAASEEEE
jgi:Fe-S-cluster containining protein